MDREGLNRMEGLSSEGENLPSESENEPSLERKESLTAVLEMLERVDGTVGAEVASSNGHIERLGGDPTQLDTLNEEYKGQIESAKVAFLSEFINSSPDVLRARINEASAFLKGGENLTAKDLEEEFALDPKTAEMYFSLSQAFSHKSEKGEVDEEVNEDDAPEEEDSLPDPEKTEDVDDESEDSEEPEESKESEEMEEPKEIEDRLEETLNGLESGESESEPKSNENLSFREIGRERLRKIGSLFSWAKGKLKDIGLAGAELLMASPEIAKKTLEVGVGATVMAYEVSKESVIATKDMLIEAKDALRQLGKDAIEKAKSAIVEAKNATIEFGNRALYRVAERIMRPFINFQIKRMEHTVRYMNSLMKKGKVSPENVERAQNTLEHLNGIISLKV